MSEFWQNDNSDRANRLRAEQLSLVARHVPPVAMANICNALVFLAACWGLPNFNLALAWAGVVISIAVFIIFRRLIRKARRTNGGKRKGVVKSVIYALALGSAWAAMPILFFPSAGPGLRLLIACLASGMMCGGAFVLASIPEAAVAFTGLIASGSIAALIRVGEPDHVLIAIVLAIYTFVLLRGVFAYADQLKTRVFTEIDAEERACARLKNLHASGLSALGGMATGLAHEISQPLAAATTYLAVAQRLIKNGSGGGEGMTPELALSQIARQLRTANEIVEHLRHLLIRGEPDKAPLRLHEVIDEVCDANNIGGKVSLMLKFGAPNDMVLADRVQIKQVLANLIRNAIDAMENCEAKELIVSTEAVDGSIRTDVVDSGPGVSPAIRAALFEPFTTTKERGMGVGLAVSRTMVEAHDGKIWAEPNPEGGAVFSFTLPLARAS
jgi:signal transduction histidine kinase